MGRRRGQHHRFSLRQSLQRIAGAALLAMVVLIIGFGVWLTIVAQGTRGPLVSSFRMVLFWIVGFLVCWFVSTALQRGKQRAFDRAGGRLCTHCRYDLRGLGEAGLCPECGRAFDTERDAKVWARAGLISPKADKRLSSAAKPPSLPVE